jgi:hypothetical protein
MAVRRRRAAAFCAEEIAERSQKMRARQWRRANQKVGMYVTGREVGAAWRGLVEGLARRGRRALALARRARVCLLPRVRARS